MMQTAPRPHRHRPHRHRPHHPKLFARSTFVTAVLSSALYLAHAEPQPQDAQVYQLLDEDYEFQMRTRPIWASLRGDRRFDAELPDLSPSSLRRQHQETKTRLRRAEALTKTHLSDRARVDLELLIYELNQSTKEASFKPEQRPITQLWGPHTQLPQLPDRLTFTRRQHLEDYLSRLEKIPIFLRQTIAQMKRGMAAKHVPPKVVMSDVIAQIEAVTMTTGESSISAHPFFKPLKQLKSDDPIVVKARRVIQEDVIPAFDRLKVFIRDLYIPACRETIGASQGVWGPSFYDFQLKRYTTLSLSAQEVHEIGLAEVKRIRAEMMQTIARSDFSQRDTLRGDVLFAAFIHNLRTNPRFYYSSSTALLRHYAQISKQMDAELPKLFKRLPRLPYGIKAMPDYIAESAPTAYYYPGSISNGIAGYFMVNTNALDQRPIYEMRALTYHEAMPGHHLQIALSQELEESGMHKWRELVHYTAFIEGWGLYAERLGLSVGGSTLTSKYGFYEDPYDDFGRLSYEMWRALRLVVDTGIHAKGWSRQRAIDLMLAHSALTQKNIENEVDRYISWPGQATAYKIGELRIRALRTQAEETLGKDFDIRDFHDAVLRNGALPLPLLERAVRAWLDRVSRSLK